MTDTEKVLAPPSTKEASESLEAFQRLYLRAQTREQAQFVLGTLVIRRFLQGKQMWVRNLLVAPMEGVKENSIVTKEASVKSWIRQYLDRLISAGLVLQEIEGTIILYRRFKERSDDLSIILSDALTGDGKALKILLGHTKSQDTQPIDIETEEEEEEVSEITTQEIAQVIQERLVEATDRDEARYALAFNALRILSVADIEFDRKGLLVTTKKTSKAVQKEISGRNWFPAFLDSCVQLGLIQQIGKSGTAILYQTDENQKQAIFDIIEDVVLAEGVKLKRIMWPNEYPTGDELNHLAGGTVQEQNTEQGLDLVQELTVQLKSVADHLQTMTDKLQTMSENFDDKMQVLDVRLEDMKALEKAVNDAFSRLMEAIKNDDRANMLQLFEKFSDMQTRRKSLSNQLEQESLKSEKLAEQLSVCVKKFGAVP